MRAVAASLAFLGLCACQTAPDLVLPPPPCPAGAVAPLEPEPLAPDLTEAQQMAIDTAVIAAVGFDLALAYTRFSSVDHPAWGRRQAHRAEAVRQECAAR